MTSSTPWSILQWFWYYNQQKCVDSLMVQRRAKKQVESPSCSHQCPWWWREESSCCRLQMFHQEWSVIGGHTSMLPLTFLVLQCTPQTSPPPSPVGYSKIWHHAVSDWIAGSQDLATCLCSGVLAWRLGYLAVSWIDGRGNVYPCLREATAKKIW